MSPQSLGLKAKKKRTLGGNGAPAHYQHSYAPEAQDPGLATLEGKVDGSQFQHLLVMQEPELRKTEVSARQRLIKVLSLEVAHWVAAYATMADLNQATSPSQNEKQSHRQELRTLFLQRGIVVTMKTQWVRFREPHCNTHVSAFTRHELTSPTADIGRRRPPACFHTQTRPAFS